MKRLLLILCVIFFSASCLTASADECYTITISSDRSSERTILLSAKELLDAIVESGIVADMGERKTAYMARQERGLIIGKKDNNDKSGFVEFLLTDDATVTVSRIVVSAAVGNATDAILSVNDLEGQTVTGSKLAFSDYVFDFKDPTELDKIKISCSNSTYVRKLTVYHSGTSSAELIRDNAEEMDLNDPQTKVYNLLGRQMPKTDLPAGIYILRTPAAARKIIIP